jgi:RNA polymerase sigma factor (sigma-70 family)
MDAPSPTVKRSTEALPQGLAEGLRIVVLRALGDGQEVDDLVQETLTRAIEAVRAGRIPDGVALGAYARGIARHVIADHMRGRSRDAAARSALPLDMLTSGSASALDALVTREEAVAVSRALERLDGRDRWLLERIYARGDRIVDVARETGEPPERLRKRKSRALERLRALIPERTDG